jgi:hypothetical protein
LAAGEEFGLNAILTDPRAAYGDVNQALSAPIVVSVSIFVVPVQERKSRFHY